MATAGCTKDEPISSQQVEDLKLLLWGADIKHDVFRRWTQGFTFSDSESSALIQHEGGPCAVIVAIQAFIIKNLIFATAKPPANWKKLQASEQCALLEQAVLDILVMVRSSSVFYVVSHKSRDQTNTDCSSTENVETGSTENAKVDTENAEVVTEDAEEGTSSPKKQCFSHELFHEGLRCTKCGSMEELQTQLRHYTHFYLKQYGVLLVLYSIILTKGLDNVRNEVEDPSESLIDGIHGHGSQSLINLLICGRAVTNVWDNDKEVSGLVLRGISRRSKIGFLTLLEHLRYCEVGWYLKNPEYPIWLLGSETHLTVLFSTEGELVSAETPEAAARRLFSHYDTEDSGFISADLLGDLLNNLELVSEPEYVKIMREKLDPEQLGIITLNSFMEEFFPNAKQSQALQTFILFHYNGLERSCPNNKVTYQEATATIMEIPELQIISDSSAIKTCVITKWPTIELKWKNNIIPSLN